MATVKLMTAAQMSNTRPGSLARNGVKYTRVNIAASGPTPKVQNGGTNVATTTLVNRSRTV